MFDNLWNAKLKKFEFSFSNKMFLAGDLAFSFGSLAVSEIKDASGTVALMVTIISCVQPCRRAAAGLASIGPWWSLSMLSTESVLCADQGNLEELQLQRFPNHPC
eukprot:c13009_g1_i2.p1 GENE.c13009_g1_i2~~c13009_g1_i2.p1  ORF type:complete len:105 (-),score=10.93 c13009_g1_i2:203-517(-)